MAWFTLFALIAAWFYVRSVKRTKLREERQKHPKTQSQSISTPQTNANFHAIEIENPEQACEAAQKLAGKRFLSMDAPLFPLPDCSKQNCQCHYKHYDDRRQEKDRRSLSTNESDTQAEYTDKRDGTKGRRKGDQIK